ncbi:MAG: gas vesicle protein GvpG [Candidatus Eisenbacteria bacterium]|nr:gas vesicle protein GvpG [Candidatus Eisenbacteria bacterium]
MAFLFDDLVFWIGKRVKEIADEELYGDSKKIHEQLLSLQTRLDMGEIQEEEYKVREMEILDRLQEAQEHEEQNET